MRTERQHQTSRDNGAKSHGPTTPEGKAASARNATKHGLTARNPILLTVEDQQAYQRVQDDYEQLFRPANVVERQLVDEMVSVQWRRQRAEAIEAAQLNFSMDRMANDIAARFDRIDGATRVALAYNHEVNESRTLHNVQRIAERLSRQYLRLLKAFQNLRENPIDPPANEIRTNEPGEPQPAAHQLTKIVEFPSRAPSGPAHPSQPEPQPAPERREDHENGLDNH